jgi:carbonic anhydrase
MPTRTATCALLCSALTFALSAAALADDHADHAATAPAAHAQPLEAVAEEIIAGLANGNARFVASTPARPHQDMARIAETAGGQHPVATVITCSDSRVCPELIFDQGLGDLFVIRVAGNVSDTDEIGTAEYGTEHLGTPLVVVLGHTNCGAVKAVCTDAEVGGSIPALVDNIVPAVNHAHAATGLEGEALVPAAVEENVRQSMHDLLAHSKIIAGLVADGKLLVVGAVYDISTGKVEWLQPQLKIYELQYDPATGQGSAVH